MNDTINIFTLFIILTCTVEYFSCVLCEVCALLLAVYTDYYTGLSVASSYAIF